MATLWKFLLVLCPSVPTLGGTLTHNKHRVLANNQHVGKGVRDQYFHVFTNYV